MTFAVADVIASLANALAPRVVVQFAVQLHIRAAQPDLLTVDTGKVRFTAGAGTIPDVESLIPHVQFPNVRRVYERKKIHRRLKLTVRPGHFVRHIDDIFVRANAIEW